MSMSVLVFPKGNFPKIYFFTRTRTHNLNEWKNQPDQIKLFFEKQKLLKRTKLGDYLVNSAIFLAHNKKWQPCSMSTCQEYSNFLNYFFLLTSSLQGQESFSFYLEILLSVLFCFLLGKSSTLSLRMIASSGLIRSG